MNTAPTPTQALPLSTNVQITKSTERVLNHGKRVAQYCFHIAKQLGYCNETAEQFKQAAVFHGVGEILLPTSLLNNLGALSNEEQKQVQTHVSNGHAILRQAPSQIMQTAAQLALKHHENFDGSGYPFGLSEKSLTLEDRILRVADTFVAITSSRSFRPAAGPKDALTVLWLEADVYFDPSVVKALEAVINEGLEIKPIAVTQRQMEYVEQLISKAKEARSLSIY